MAIPAPSPSALLLAAGAAAIALLSFLAGTAPALALALGGGALILALAFATPVAHLTIVLAVAAIVPYDLQNRFGLSAGGGSAGLVLIDVLLLAGLAWATVRLVSLLRERFDGRSAAVLLLLTAFFAVASVQLVRGIALGRDPGIVGYEWRNLLGLGVAYMAFPLLLDRESRHRAMIGLIVVGLLLGLWGNAQWLLEMPANVSEDIGVREGVAHTTSGAGQVLGGRYAFPAAVVLSFAALVSGRSRMPAATVALLAVLLLNTVALILTFERAFWVGSVLALLLVILRAGRAQRMRAIVWGALSLVLVAAAFSVIAPGQATAVRERFLSLGQYDADSSVDYRLIETRHVIAEITGAEVAGSGLGASIHWGRPAEGVPASTETYSHNAYLRLAWKLGIPGALLLVAALAAALIGRRSRDPSTAVLHSGAKAALLATLIMGVTGPVFDSIGASAIIGLLIALALALPADRTRERPDAIPAPA